MAAAIVMSERSSAAKTTAARVTVAPAAIANTSAVGLTDSSIGNTELYPAVVVDLLFRARDRLPAGARLRGDYFSDLLPAKFETRLEVCVYHRRANRNSGRHRLASSFAPWHSRALHRGNEFARIDSWRRLPDHLSSFYAAGLSFALLGPDHCGA